ncbi:hypothetical protein BP00DRAFT_218274 [Aspergillus indologenus CBS 114.80]|uniref:Uncharacterized protein n=1 Tax=Aspergillus indologenus CBS 114.80 TaxID=1450541 RepID=A0A2V5IG41_9EURO|nr:hypothetical protein BP00DRAFT_218274 [Aspergillus indologenus CBS 114.80]
MLLVVLLPLTPRTCICRLGISVTGSRGRHILSSFQENNEIALWDVETENAVQIIEIPDTTQLLRLSDDESYVDRVRSLPNLGGFDFRPGRFFVPSHSPVARLPGRA